MTDFTKEDLKTLHAICFDCVRRILSYKDMNEAARVPNDLMNKIQSMIDNYRDCQQVRDINSINPYPTCGDHHD